MNASTYGFHNVNEMNTPIAKNNCITNSLTTENNKLDINQNKICFEYKYINCLSLTWVPNVCQDIYVQHLLSLPSPTITASLPTLTIKFTWGSTIILLCIPKQDTRFNIKLNNTNWIEIHLQLIIDYYSLVWVLK